MTGHHVYILRCSDGSLYVGYTTDPKRRLQQHNSGKASRYTRGRLPVMLVYLENATSMGTALRREVELKRMGHEQKLKLIMRNPFKIEPSCR